MTENSLIRYVFQPRSREYQYSREERHWLRRDTRSFLADLTKYRISLRRLCEKQVSYEDRNKILNISLLLINNTPVAQALVAGKELPVLEAAKACGVSHKYIECFRPQIIAYMLLFGTEDYSFLSRQLAIGTRWEGGVPPEQNDLGFKLKNFGVTAAVLTPYGEFRFLDSSNPNAKAGDFIHGTPALLKPRRALLLGAIALALIACVILFSFIFTRPVNSFTILGNVEASFSFNRFHRLVDSQGINNNGRLVLEHTVFSDNKLDSSLASFLLEAVKQKKLSPEAELTLVVVMGEFSPEDFHGAELNRQLREHNLRLKVNMGNGEGFILDPQ